MCQMLICCMKRIAKNVPLRPKIWQFFPVEENCRESFSKYFFPPFLVHPFLLNQPSPSWLCSPLLSANAFVAFHFFPLSILASVIFFCTDIVFFFVSIDYLFRAWRLVHVLNVKKNTRVIIRFFVATPKSYVLALFWEAIKKLLKLLG